MLSEVKKMETGWKLIFWWRSAEVYFRHREFTVLGVAGKLQCLIKTDVCIWARWKAEQNKYLGI